ncbi:MAG: wax ester/triacylglycerol synthase family O-acyltransferase [bacterium]|nr:wax ester/triacylglycerol synthase family O-acyltransferase [bacterium]
MPSPHDLNISYLHSERTPLHIGVAILLEGVPDPVIVAHETEQLLELFPSLTFGEKSNITSEPSRYFSYQKLDYSITSENFANITSSLAYGAFPKQGPLWRISFAVSADKKTTACVFVIHHMLCDGLGVMQIVHQLAQKTTNPETRNIKISPQQQISDAPKQFPSLSDLAKVTNKGLTCNFRDKLSSSYDLTGANSSVRKFAFLPEIATTAETGERSLTIKLLCAATSGLRNMLEECLIIPDFPANALLPIAINPLRRRRRLGNHFVSMPISLPIHIEDIDEQSLWLKNQLISQLSDKKLQSTDRLFAALYRLPPYVQKYLFPWLCRKAALHTTLIPASWLKKRSFFFSRRCLSIYPLLSPPPGMGLSFGVIFNGKSFLPSLTWDPKLIKDEKKLIGSFVNSCSRHLR